jgi:hypothetical protein
MSEVIEVIEQVVPVEVPVVEVIPELPELKYEFQPEDENGGPIGGLHVIKYRTHEELATKLREQNVLLIRKLRSETRKNRMGIVDNETIPEEAPRFPTPIEFKPRELTNDERYDISRKLLDPTTALEATSTLLEASIGGSLKQFGETIRDVQQDNIRLRAKVEADSFVADNPTYFKCKENWEAMTSWMLRYDLAPVKSNFQKAYDTLKLHDAIVEAPTRHEPVPVVVEPVAVVPVEVIIPTPVTEPIAVRVATGLTRASASDVGTSPRAGSDIVYELRQPDGSKTVLTGLAALNAMPSDDYKRLLLTDPTFGKKVDKLEADARKPRQ